MARDRTPPETLVPLAGSRDRAEMERVAAWLQARGIPAEVLREPPLTRWEVRVPHAIRKAARVLYESGAAVQADRYGTIAGRIVSAWDEERA